VSVICVWKENAEKKAEDARRKAMEQVGDEGERGDHTGGEEEGEEHWA
jgi:hypothetical protein